MILYLDRTKECVEYEEEAKKHLKNSILFLFLYSQSKHALIENAIGLAKANFYDRRRG